MTETEVDSYSLDCKAKKFSLKLCLYNGQQVLFELSNKNGPEKYRALFTLQQLQDLSFSFNSCKTSNDALTAIKNLIEEGKITVEEISESKIEIEFTTDSSPFIVNLILENQEINEIPENAQNVEYKTTEVNNIVESEVKPDVMEFEYIQPILQLHYPDGSTKNTPLTPTLQGAEGKNLNISEQQLKNI